MFRERDAQGDLLEQSSFLTREKVERLRASWADVFRRKALRLIDEKRFAALYCEDNGRPNVPVELLVGALLLKEMFDLTDVDLLQHVEWNLEWHHALRLRSEDAHLCQKTLHNFRARLMANDMGRVVFETTAEKIIEALGTKVTRQRLDSTHIASNVARLTRLGLFVETIRAFLRCLRRDHPKLYGQVPVGLRRRYLDDEGRATSYGDGRPSDVRRRLDVCARDVYRLWQRFKRTASNLEAYQVLDRLFREQCEIDPKTPPPEEDDDDAGERQAPVRVKTAKDIASASLQTPHDPDVTYSGHKGKGYSVQVAETCHEDNATEIITHVAVTPACKSDAHATIPTLESLSMRGLHAEELLADTTYGSGPNAVEAEQVGTRLVSPVAGATTSAPLLEDGQLTVADFTIDLTGRTPDACPAGVAPTDVLEEESNRHRLEFHFAADECSACPLYMRCPARYRAATNTFVMNIDLIARNLEQRRRAQATPDFATRYALRAGIEATNSELKRKHGLRRLRVRGRPRVELATYFKAAACNVKRMINVLLKPPDEPRAQPA